VLLHVEPEVERIFGGFALQKYLIVRMEAARATRRKVRMMDGGDVRRSRTNPMVLVYACQALPAAWEGG
jgi:hypothetical protein